jgi:hypothetical protein
VALMNNKPMAAPSPFSAIITLLYEPTITFERLETRSMAWFPLIAITMSSCALILWYYSIVDFSWLVDQMLANVNSAEDREKSAEFLSKQMMVASSIGGILIGYPIICVILSTYLVITSKAASSGISFGKGFALVAWANVPNFLLFLLGGMQILLNSSGKIGLSELNPVSLNQLFFQFNVEHPLAGVMDSLSLTTLWSMFLLVIGFEIWANVRRSTAILIILLPHIIVYGLWLGYGVSKFV